jgi:molybdate transport system substrate-binding protein
VRFSFAGSDELAAQIRQGVVPDVYAAANTSLPDDLAEEGLLERPHDLATNRLVVAVPAGSEIDDVSDLEKPGVTVAIGDESVPVGEYTREVLDALGPDPSEAILANVATSEPDVGGIVGKLTQGAVDAGFVYRTDVEAAGGELDAIELPASVSPDVTYGIAVASDAPEPALAREFVGGTLDGDGRRILLDAGFGPPPR